MDKQNCIHIQHSKVFNFISVNFASEQGNVKKQKHAKKPFATELYMINLNTAKLNVHTVSKTKLKEKISLAASL